MSRPAKTKVTYKCIDCGKERTGFLHDFHGTPPERYRCLKCYIKYENDVSSKKLVTRVCISCGTIRTARPELFSKPPEEYLCRKCNLEKQRKDAEWVKKQKIGVDKRRENSNWTENHKNAILKLCKNEEWQKNINEAAKVRSENPIWYENHLIAITGEGIWYGNLSLRRFNNGDYDKRLQHYCEIFKEVDPRVRAFQNNMCLLCEKTEEENGKRMHDHHVFYEKKTCCWVDDSGEYWTNLNAKDHSKKDYYIGDNPNYFALLCTDCHGKTNGSYENRKFWADTFKNIIDTKFNDKSYYTEEEMVEQGYIKISRTKWKKLDINK